MEANTVDSILEALEKAAERKGETSPEFWIDGCQKLLALLGNEEDRYYELEHLLAKVKMEAMMEGDTASKAKVKAESRTEHLEAKKLKAKINRIFEMIRIAKVRAKMATDEYKSN